ncbi:indolepyruvate ferredoxin oxidoreductase family protein [Rhodobacter sp.]
MSVSLDDKYSASSGPVYLTGTQALVRLPMVQMRRDRAAGLSTGGFISGYRGSPLGAYDQQLEKAKRFLDREDIVFQPGLNEDLAAAAVWGSQQLHLSPGARKDGLLGIWYGKGPGVDRSGDVFKHANAAGTAAHGGVLAIAGDDHTCKSSSIPHQSDHAFISALMPMLYPSSLHEFLELGLLGVAMSRYSGCWVGFKVISETVETTTVVDLAQEDIQFRLPDDFEMPPGGLNLRWPDPPLVQDERLQEHKGYAAIAFARAHGVNRVTIADAKARFGVVASGKAYEDVRQALVELGIGPAEQAAIGLRLYKVRMPWPLEPEGIRHFSEGLEEILIVEERREIIENQIKQQLFNWRADVRPRIIGKFDDADRPFLHHSSGLTVGTVAAAIAERVTRLALPEGLADRIRARLAVLHRAEERAEGHAAPVIRLPHFCAGCPHNTSTRVPAGSKAMAGIGCHFMAQWMDRNTETFTHMGAEGVPWTAISRFTDEPHRFVNLGDGTWFHSGHLAIRQAVAAGANVTYKILYNDAVAMTGGQPVDGVISPARIAHQVFQEGVARVVLLSEEPGRHAAADLPPGTKIGHRDEIDAVMQELRQVPGVTVLIFDQTCAAEKRRRRKRGLMEDPDLRVWINPAVCEGCGDCSVQSNCVAVEPLETEFGRKRKIDQSACNKDYSCVKGFCPSFVSVRGGSLRRAPAVTAQGGAIPDPVLPVPDGIWNLVVTGIGGTGVLTIGALVAMAAHVEGRVPMVLDMAGLAQKGGAVLSQIRIGDAAHPPTAPRITAGRADLLLGADAVVAAARDTVVLCDPARTVGVVSTAVTPVAAFTRERDFDFRAAAVEREVAAVLRGREHFLDFRALAETLTGDAIGANLMMLGYAWQQGLVPLRGESILTAIGLNGVAVKANEAAFLWGRRLAHDRDAVLALAAPKPVRRQAEMTVEELIAQRAAHLTDYQDAALADRFMQRVRNLSQIFDKNGESVLRQAVISYARVLAYKDEYEVARLYSRPEFRAALTAEFDGTPRLALNLAPPFLPGKAPDGRPKKRAFGPWIFPVLKVMARLKGLRGTWADPFARSPDRRLDREWIALVEEDLDLAAALWRPDRAAALTDLLSVADQVRGYGPVKEAASAQQKRRREEIRARLLADDPAQVAAE